MFTWSRGPGPEAVTSCHDAPSHSHVSPSVVFAEPPKSTVRPRPSSKASAWRNRPAGPVSAACVHDCPSQVQVSGGKVELPSLPPKSTVRARAASWASRWKARALGPEVARWLQAEPSHSQVSPRTDDPPWPPKSTTRWRPRSYAQAAPVRAVGPVVDARDQALPFQVQVSALRPLRDWPPKRTSTPRASSTTTHDWLTAGGWAGGGEGPPPLLPEQPARRITASESWRMGREAARPMRGLQTVEATSAAGPPRLVALHSDLAAPARSPAAPGRLAPAGRTVRD